jgi:hypothetical protein
MAPPPPPMPDFDNIGPLTDQIMDDSALSMSVTFSFVIVGDSLGLFLLPSKLWMPPSPRWPINSQRKLFYLLSNWSSMLTIKFWNKMMRQRNGVTLLGA